MPSLIDQMNILKNLPDGALAGELSQPTGAVPPYLVLSEVNRRKDMRQRFEGQMALKKPQTTVVQDQLAGLAPPNPSTGGMGAAAGQGAPMASPGGVGSSPMMPGAPMPASPPSGIAAVPTGYRNGGVVHYANGGYVDGTDQAALDRARLADMYGAPSGIAAAPTMDFGANAPAFDTSSVGNPNADTSGTVALPPVGQDYSGINAQYEKQLVDANAAKARDPWLALMQAGLSIAGGTSPYALTNIGAGGAQGLDTYAALMKGDNASATAANEGLMGVKQQQTKDQVANIDQANEAAKFAASQDPNSPQNTPQALREAQMINAMPTDTQEHRDAKDAAMRIATPFAVQKAGTIKDQAAQIGDAIIAGDQPPTTTGMGYGMAGPVKAYLAGKGYDLTNAYLKYQADLKNISALNSPAQTRLRQSISQLEPTLDSAQALADKWDGSGFPPFNHAALIAAKNDPTNPEKQALATNLLAQVDHVTAELGQVYMGGNTPTDAAFKLSGSQLSGEWSRATFDAAIKQIKENLSYRKASLNQAAVSGAPVGAAPAAADTPAPLHPAATVNPDGTMDLGNGVTMRQVSP